MAVRLGGTTATVGLLPLVSLLGCLCGCVEPDLGDVPFYCNHGDPECPEGYSCLQGMCVRNGAFIPDTKPWPDGAVDLVGSPELIKLDGSSFPDAPISEDGVTKWDTGPPDSKPSPDQKIKPDGWPPHLGCQSHSECTDSSSPCCCPTPLIPQIWTCLPFCLNPFCI
jgi:hypothetical protein